jgi:hypothetical protein
MEEKEQQGLSSTLWGAFLSVGFPSWGKSIFTWL